MGKHSKYERYIAVTKNGEQYAQERMLFLSMMKKRRAGLLTIKQDFDLQGDWNLQLVQSYKENEKEELIKNEVKVPLFVLKMKRQL